MEEDDTEIQRRVLEEAFGESSDDEGPARSAADPFLSKKPIWESVNGIKGLWLCRGFLSIKQQSLLLSAIEREGWFSDGSHNQAMRFGDLPEWATELTRFVREAVCSGEVSFEASRESTFEDQYAEETCPLPLDLLWREPLFDQLISNVYEPGEGICAHVDLMRFEDGIAIVSLESACVMHFIQCEAGDGHTGLQGEETSSTRIPILLSPGSLILMSGEARYLWKHEINRRPGHQLWEGKEIGQQRRTSVTLRKLCKSPS
ncbi:alkylated DNA repair protein alkB homolog 8 isoform X1 [Phoenix dactylifera]|uniref:Alkylated DNA repair protein alkB homolog 8 isoform X1 n=1 Tax=Phoenix dactylifera TaxID=42345 RepID=A0A8B7CK31_PHODC|nr:alkylated DNA repair protein alkB homolog 8 isoform X1 [Phoenix dactylifera]